MVRRMGLASSSSSPFLLNERSRHLTGSAVRLMHKLLSDREIYGFPWKAGTGMTMILQIRSSCIRL